MIGQRILAIAAAVFFVLAVALAVLEPPTMPLGQLLYTADHTMLRSLEAWIDQHSSHWIWSWGFVPMLVRPVWLLPAALGIICAGLSMTLASRHAARNAQPRRRS